MRNYFLVIDKKIAIISKRDTEDTGIERIDVRDMDHMKYKKDSNVAIGATRDTEDVAITRGSRSVSIP